MIIETWVHWRQKISEKNYFGWTKAKRHDGKISFDNRHRDPPLIIQRALIGLGVSKNTPEGFVTQAPSKFWSEKEDPRGDAQDREDVVFQKLGWIGREVRGCGDFYDVTVCLMEPPEGEHVVLIEIDFGLLGGGSCEVELPGEEP